MESEVCPNHVYILLEISPRASVSSFMRVLKGKSNLLIYKRYLGMYYKYGNRELGRWTWKKKTHRK